MRSLAWFVVGCLAVASAKADEVTPPPVPPTPRTTPLDVGRAAAVRTRPRHGVLEPSPLALTDGRSGWVVRLSQGSRSLAVPPGSPLGSVSVSWPSAAVADGRVYVGGGLVGQDLFALDARSGRHLWTRPLADNGPAAPAVTRGKVVVTTESCTTYVITPGDGALSWSRRVGPTIMGAPTVVGDRVYVAHVTDTNGGAALTAMHLRDGQVLWKRPLPSDVVGAPVHASGRIVLAGRDGALVAFGLDGTPQWSLRDADASSAPWFGAGRLYVATGSGLEEGAPPVLCVEAATGRVLWRSHRGDVAEEDEGQGTRPGRTSGETATRPGRASGATVTRPGRALPEVFFTSWGWADDPPRPCLVDGRLAIAGGRELLLLDPRDGSVEHVLLLPRGQRFHSPPAVLGGHLLFATLDGLLLEIDPAERTVVASVDLGGTLNSQPVAADGRVFVVAENLLYAVPWEMAEDGGGWPQWGGGPGRDG